MENSKRLIVFFIPPEKIINGGILSIFSICAVSRSFKSIHKANVVLCVYPGSPSYKKNDYFKNDEYIYSFEEIVAKGSPDFLLLNVPEYASSGVCDLLDKYSDYMSRVKDLRVNILNQNILLMPSPEDLAKWYRHTSILTQTTAHDRYSTQETADLYNTPLKHISVYVDPRQYRYIDYEKKENIIVLSHDKSRFKAGISARLKKELPQYRQITIKDMAYDNYKQLISRAKFAISFGEGFDGYYIEPFLSGGISFSVYNDDFFPSKVFAGFDNTFESYEEMQNMILAKMKDFDNEKRYRQIVKSNYREITKLYNFGKYRDNIKAFYAGDSDFIPTPDASIKLISRLAVLINGQDKRIHQIESDSQQYKTDVEGIISALRNTIDDLRTNVQQKNHELTNTRTSAVRRAVKSMRQLGKNS